MNLFEIDKKESRLNKVFWILSCVVILGFFRLNFFTEPLILLEVFLIAVRFFKVRELRKQRSGLYRAAEIQSANNMKAAEAAARKRHEDERKASGRNPDVRPAKDIVAEAAARKRHEDERKAIMAQQKKPVEKKPVDTRNENIGKPGNTDSNSADIESAANDLIAAFFEGYLVSCVEVRGEDSEPDLSAEVSLVDGRELLLNANKNIASSSPSEVRKLVEKAAELFELCYRSPVIDEQGYIAESRAQARMWLGISQSILSYDSQSFDLPQTKGPGFAFAESASIFLGLQNFQMLGRVLQEWAESLLYVGNEKDALGLFQIAMLTFNSFGEKERAGVVLNRLKDLSPSKIDSAFLARGPVPGQEQMTTVLGCRNTSELRRICEIGFNILDFLPNRR